MFINDKSTTKTVHFIENYGFSKFIDFIKVRAFDIATDVLPTLKPFPEVPEQLLFETIL